MEGNVTTRTSLYVSSEHARYDLISRLRDLATETVNTQTAPLCAKLSELLRIQEQSHELQISDALLDVHASLAERQRQCVELQRANSKLITQSGRHRGTIHRLNQELRFKKGVILSQEIKDLQALKMESENSVQSLRGEIRTQQGQLELIQSELRKHNDCWSLYRQLRQVGQEKSAVLDMYADLQLRQVEMELENGRFRMQLGPDESKRPIVTVPLGSSSEYLRNRFDSGQFSSTTDASILAQAVVYNDNQINGGNGRMTKRGAGNDLAHERAFKRLKTSSEIASDALTVKSYFDNDKSKQASFDALVQQVALQPAFVSQAIDPALIISGETGIVSLSPSGLERFARQQEDGSLTRKNAAERQSSSTMYPIGGNFARCSYAMDCISPGRSSCVALPIASQLKGRQTLQFSMMNIDIARQPGPQSASSLAFNNDMMDKIRARVKSAEPVIDIDEIIKVLQESSEDVKPHLTGLSQAVNNLVDEDMREMSDADIDEFVKEMKEKYIRHLFCTYTSYSEASSIIDPVLSLQLEQLYERHPSTFAERKRVRKALRCILVKYQDLNELLGDIERD